MESPLAGWLAGGKPGEGPIVWLQEILKVFIFHNKKAISELLSIYLQTKE